MTQKSNENLFLFEALFLMGQLIATNNFYRLLDYLIALCSSAASLISLCSEPGISALKILSSRHTAHRIRYDFFERTRKRDLRLLRNIYARKKGQAPYLTRKSCEGSRNCSFPLRETRGQEDLDFRLKWGNDLSKKACWSPYCYPKGRLP